MYTKAVTIITRSRDGEANKADDAEKNRQRRIEAELSGKSEISSRLFFGRPSREEAKPCSADFNFRISESRRFQAPLQPCRIDEQHGVANVKDRHQQGLHTVSTSEDAARPEDPVDLSQQPVLQCR
jgi:hypothetical protein